VGQQTNAALIFKDPRCVKWCGTDSGDCFLLHKHDLLLLHIHYIITSSAPFMMLWL